MDKFAVNYGNSSYPPPSSYDLQQPNVHQPSSRLRRFDQPAPYYNNYGFNQDVQAAGQDSQYSKYSQYPSSPTSGDYTGRYQSMQDGAAGTTVIINPGTLHQVPLQTQPAQAQYAVVFGSQPQMFLCTNCQQMGKTVVKYKASSRTHLNALILCCLFGCLGCCCIPYCVGSCQTAEHYCRYCNSFLGMNIN